MRLLQPIVASSSLLLLLACVACKTSVTEPDGDTQGGAGSDSQMQAGNEQSGQSGQDGQSSGGTGGQTGPEQPSSDGGTAGGPNESGLDAATEDPDPQDASMSATDAGSTPDAAADAGPEGTIGAGSCCAAHDTPGCSNADLQVCVCELLSSCCTEAWNAACALIVAQKYCQPGVRECVCGDAEGQWQQHSCCEVDWTDTYCDNVAETKCDAVPGCM